jgi:hypothetical protein
METQMSNSNTYLAQQAAAVENPLTFASTAGQDKATTVATTDANIDLIIALISLEGADSTVPRGFMDEISPPARITLYKILTDLKTSVAA